MAGQGIQLSEWTRNTWALSLDIHLFTVQYLPFDIIYFWAITMEFGAIPVYYLLLLSINI